MRLSQNICRISENGCELDVIFVPLLNQTYVYISVLGYWLTLWVSVSQILSNIKKSVGFERVLKLLLTRFLICALNFLRVGHMKNISGFMRWMWCRWCCEKERWDLNSVKFRSNLCVQTLHECQYLLPDNNRVGPAVTSSFRVSGLRSLWNDPDSKK